jgi:tRNA-specific 2-thiouridylase
MLKLNLNKPIDKTRVVVAMSGGVDSSVAAALMKEAGYDVIGITLQLYDLGVDLEKKGACCAGQDIYDARQVADKISIPHYVLNYESVFQEEVIEDFVDNYLNGETPIPCIKCNQTVKFRDLFKMAKDLDADALVTGHYAKIIRENNQVEMHKAKDQNKDQSYFLFATTQEQLNFLHLPLGDYSKEYTRELAEKFALPTKNKPDSQDICFVPNGDYVGVIKKYRPDAIKPGEVVDKNGKVLGYHPGIAGFTLGQRRGIGISGEQAFYVIKIDAANNKIVVGEEADLNNYNFTVRDVNWYPLDKNEREVTVKTRYRQQPTKARIKFVENGIEVMLAEAVKAVTPGQACVFYDGDRLLGGGWINKIIK